MATPETEYSRVCILGVGACTAVGKTAAATAAAVRARVSGFAQHPFMVDQAGQRMVVARASYLPNDPEGAERLVELALPAVREALSSLTTGPLHRLTLPVIVGLQGPRPGHPQKLESRLTERLGELLSGLGLRSAVETIPVGHASGLLALETAWKRIQSGGATFYLVVGVDSYLEPETLEWLEDCDQVHSAGLENNAWGFIPGEGAGACLLGSRPATERQSVSVQGHVLAVATAHEKNVIKTEAVCLGQGLTEAFRKALQALPWPGGPKVDQIICDMNGEPYRANEYGFTVIRTSQRFVDAGGFLAPADCWGDVGAASGPLFVGLAAAAARKGYARGPHVLLWASSEGGERGAALLRLEVQPRSRADAGHD